MLVAHSKRTEALGRRAAVRDRMSLLGVTGGNANNYSKTGIDWDFAIQPGYMATEAEGGRENRARTVGMKVINIQMAEHGVDGMTLLGMESKEKKIVKNRLPTSRRWAEQEEPQRGLQSMTRDWTKSQEGGAY